MMLPYVTSATAGVILLLQMALSVAVSGARNRRGLWIGSGDNPDLLRLVRRHGNLAENSGLFVTGFALLELSGRLHMLLVAACAIFVSARMLHAVGLSRLDTRNLFRLIGSLATVLTGMVLGVALLWTALAA